MVNVSLGALTLANTQVEDASLIVGTLTAFRRRWNALEEVLLWNESLSKHTTVVETRRKWRSDVFSIECMIVKKTVRSADRKSDAPPLFWLADGKMWFFFFSLCFYAVVACFVFRVQTWSSGRHEEHQHHVKFLLWTKFGLLASDVNVSALRVERNETFLLPPSGHTSNQKLFFLLSFSRMWAFKLTGSVGLWTGSCDRAAGSSCQDQWTVCSV